MQNIVEAKFYTGSRDDWVTLWKRNPVRFPPATEATSGLKYVRQAVAS